MTSLKTFLLLAGIAVLGGCIDPYKPELKSGAGSQLVVNGYLDSGTGDCTITLSRTQDIYSAASPEVESFALVKVETESGATTPLTEITPGTYQVLGSSVDPNTRYRLMIQTQNGETYQSAYTTARTATPIDSLTWKVDDFRKGIQIYAYAHDDLNQTKFYRWAYEETWQYHSAYQSVMEYDPDIEFVRYRNDDIYNCWHTLPGFKIITASTAKLKNDVISQQPLVFIPELSPKITVRYSVLVRQFAISEAEYTYYETLRKNTENLGTLFDPLPSQLAGNILCTSNPNLVAIGYFSVQHPSSMRLFISNREYAPSLNADTGYQKCTYDTLLLADIPKRIKGIGEVYTFIGPVTQTFFTIGYSYSTNQCVDCRLTGGTTLRPAFW